MKFNEMKYMKIDIDKWQKEFDKELKLFETANTVEDKLSAIDRINKERNHFETMENLAHVRHVIDTSDEFYEAQVNHFDTISPFYQRAVTTYYQSLVGDPMRDELRERLGDHLFNLAAVKLRTFKDEILEDLAKENRLSTEYTKLRTSIEIDYDNKKLNLSQIGPYLEVVDREKRKEAYYAMESAIEEKSQEFNTIFDEMVKLRHQIALKLGYDNFIGLAYDRLSRTDYDHGDVRVFRESVRDHLVPNMTTLYQKQAARLSIDALKFYDIGLSFTSGNPTPKGDPDWIVEQGRTMYHELSSETGVFIDHMIDNELMDLVAKPSKAGGGFCTYIPDYQAPFIFSNFNGTMGDIDVLTHEAGHAFQVYESRHHQVPEYLWPTLEACEIHSMSMEFLTYPWMNSFFKEDTEKYYYTHMSEAIKFIPYGVLVDHFQHWVYEHPYATPKERNDTWRTLEKEYLPHKDYDGHEFLESGTYWFRQGHIFKDPFYYIDYTLAAVCAFQFWQKANLDRDTAFSDYLNLCKQGGSQPFTQLVADAGLKQPFEKDTLRTIATDVVEYLSSIDDSKF
ncbi:MULTISPECIES: M3 family oligoendopeptidase [unclassified Fusibacter]|uniref:M3 family oligoendopeptidase n=1 Tax=unclassified Fusibacter TaxID=2624464 RepID=UPI001012D23A|nr:MULTISPECIES: M3 family oligoendopeptidase [unclassified Fusibacter]MCK8061444.1 M3 family oligoendopeptidase [Fusibacter sp. A2]NPE23631.1 M3 family oligoendopeptidase [Fusibacter sp. A1]RXV58904.1 M3 family oligoendopeptidase [Fusibacter sp. A1]